MGKAPYGYVAEFFRRGDLVSEERFTHIDDIKARANQLDSNDESWSRSKADSFKVYIANKDGGKKKLFGLYIPGESRNRYYGPPTWRKLDPIIGQLAYDRWDKYQARLLERRDERLYFEKDSAERHRTQLSEQINHFASWLYEEHLDVIDDRHIEEYVAEQFPITDEMREGAERHRKQREEERKRREEQRKEWREHMYGV